MKSVLLFLMFFLLFLTEASACPVCFSAKEDTRLFYYLTTSGLIGIVCAIAAAWGVGLRRYLQQENRWKHDEK